MRWKFRTVTAWRDVPERYGPWATLHTRFRRWALDGTFERMFRAALARADAVRAADQISAALVPPGGLVDAARGIAADGAEGGEACRLGT
ncbi:transposase [Streptomyces sp. NPDC001275]